MAVKELRDLYLYLSNCIVLLAEGKILFKHLINSNLEHLINPSVEHLILKVRKRAFGHARPAKIQIRLPICCSLISVITRRIGKEEWFPYRDNED